MEFYELCGSYAAMGAAQGARFRRAGVRFHPRLDGFQLRHGAASAAVLREVFPEAWAEAEAVSAAVGMDPGEVAAWLLCMGCCLYDLARNVPEYRGCAAFAFRRAGRVFYGRNNDLPSYLRRGCKSILYAPAGGRRFLLATSAFLHGEEGVNEDGLIAAMTFVLTDPADLRPGLNACLAVRYLLERAGSTAQALDLLADLPLSSNCCLLLADAAGELAVAECAPARRVIRRSDAAVCAVNCFQTPALRPLDAARGADYRAAERYRVVLEALPRLRGDPVRETRRLLRGEYGFLCQYDDVPDFETVWSTVCDLPSRTVRRAAGDPRSSPFRLDRRLVQTAVFPG